MLKKGRYAPLLFKVLFMKKCVYVFIGLLVVLSLVATWGYGQVQQLLEAPVNHSEDQLITIERGTSGAKLVAQLEKEGIVEKTTALSWLPWILKAKPELNKIKAGTYALKDVNNLAQLLTLLNSGKEVQLSVQFIEGKTFKDWRKNLQNAPYLKQTLADRTPQEIFDLLDIPATSSEAVYQWRNLDGWLYPDTYHYTPNSTDLELLQRASARMQKALRNAWDERDADLPLANPYEMLILASIVEKETGIAAERPMVASVFINRLKAKMKLQTDPTVIYGMGDEYNGNIRKKDLEAATPYNTYVIEGLPPTPIAMVSESALQAVAHPAKSDFYYFVADGSGGHKFTRNLNEHNKAVQEYLRWYRNQPKGNQ